MPIQPRVHVLIPALALSMAITSQQVVVAEGQPGETRLVAFAAGAGTPGTTLASRIVFLPLAANGRRADELGQTGRARTIADANAPRIQLPNGDRLFAVDRGDVGHKQLLLGKGTGELVVALDDVDGFLDGLAVATDHAHAVLADDVGSLAIARLRGAPLQNGTMQRRVTGPLGLEPGTVMVGPTHLFFTTDDHRVFRCALAAGDPEDITPAGTGAIPAELAIAGDGRTVAFLRETIGDRSQVWLAGATGPARMIALPEREYREIGYLPNGDGHPRLLLNHDGSRCMATEIGGEDEIWYVDTTATTPPVQVTRDTLFSPYIGIHILPSFRGHILTMASGHLGWHDWYSFDGTTVANLTETGSPEPPFLVGSLDVAQAWQLANGARLATDRVGAQQNLRRIEPGSALIASDLLEEPVAGHGIDGIVDLLVRTAAGDRLVSGVDGRIVAAAPGGVSLLPPVRSRTGLIATAATIGNAFSVPILMLTDGSAVFGGFRAGVPQIAFDGAGSLVLLYTDALVMVGPGHFSSRPLSAGTPRLLLSGASG